MEIEDFDVGVSGNIGRYTIEGARQLTIGVKVTQREQRLLVGFAVYPFPHERATKNLRLKNEGGFDWPEGEKRRFVWFFQLTTGF